VKYKSGKRLADMKTILMSCKVTVLLCLLGAGFLMAGSRLNFSQDGGKMGAESQGGLIDGVLQARIIPPALDHINITLVLLCSGLIGFLGVRRKKNTFNDNVKIKAPEAKYDQKQFVDDS
jgi:hypothetical protein